MASRRPNRLRPDRSARRPNPPKRDKKGARRGGLGLIARFQAWLLRHAQTLVFTLGRISRRPGSSSLTAGVIGVALALPAAMYVLVENTSGLAGNWEGVSRVSVFMEPGSPESRARSLREELEARSEVSQVEHISAEAAMEEFTERSGFGDALAVLEENPLPPVLVVHPTESAATPEGLRALVSELQDLEEVDLVQVDTQWIERFHAMLEIAERGIAVVAALLALAVLIVVGNTIRLEIQNRREEIEVTKLVGATDAFIRRPFLYTGLWYGVFGGVLACLLVTGAVWVLHDPVRSLAGLYGSGFQLSGLGFLPSLQVLGVGALLGWGGSWLAVARHLSEIEPA
ncbi:cell division transport system permease protein [Natronospira proteinivora]|uniref:Cell division protein FtsX n=1 Tax=Natronospira proteinivora TaxID=1807133 RepID=A0ABT1G9E0_9GAMM|nr:permease-like cell division protein FtsX [Natronospira proteinivora]MCP1727940.1 cell division transport system permease protein [Natronospira proteinivora]